jgi:RimJ/RimL family protein N-acetyltransferase
MRRPKG